MDVLSFSFLFFFPFLFYPSPLNWVLFFPFTLSSATHQSEHSYLNYKGKRDKARVFEVPPGSLAELSSLLYFYIFIYSMWEHHYTLLTWQLQLAI